MELHLCYINTLNVMCKLSTEINWKLPFQLNQLCETKFSLLFCLYRIEMVKESCAASGCILNCDWQSPNLIPPI